MEYEASCQSAWLTSLLAGVSVRAWGFPVEKEPVAGQCQCSLTPTYLLGDHLGSTSLTTDAAGVKTSEMRYSPWGEVRYTWTKDMTPGLPSRYTFTGQYSYMDDPTTTAAEGFGLMFYNARWYDVQLGRFAQADTVVPGGAQGLDRYAYVLNNPLKYVDPSGHTPECGPDGAWCGGGNWVNPVPPKERAPSRGETELRLTKYGKDVKELYDLFLSTPGYWQELIAGGDDPFTLFLAILLSKESGPLWTNLDAGWGEGGNQDPKEWFSDASNHWIWGWVEDHYGVTFDSLSPEGRINAVFNLLGRMESVEGVINASNGVLKDKKTPDSQYSELSPNNRLILAMQESDYHSDLYSITSNALSNPVTGYWTWGNAQNVNKIPSDAVYRYDNFYILSRYAD